MIITAQNHFLFETESGEIIMPSNTTKCFLDGERLVTEIGKPIQLKNDMSYIRFDCTKAYGEEVLSAERIWVELRGHMMFAIDRIKTKVPVKPISRFAVNNSNGDADIRIFHDKRVVVRQNGFGIKILPCEMLNLQAEMTETKNPDGTPFYDFKSADFVTEYIGAFALIQDIEPDIPAWHLYEPENHSRQINPKDNSGRLGLTVQKDGKLLLEDTRTGEQFILE